MTAIAPTKTPLPFTEEAIREMLNESIQQVFSTMLSLDVSPESTDVLKGIENLSSFFEGKEELVVSMIGFVGETSCVVYLHIPASLMRVWAGAFLGMDEAEMDAEGPGTMDDALGEISNMAIGSFKNKLCDSGYDCRLTLPSIIKGTNFTIEINSSVARYTCPYKCGDRMFFVDLVFKKNS